jgi:hypothetical protein
MSEINSRNEEIRSRRLSMDSLGGVSSRGTFYISARSVSKSAVAPSNVTSGSSSRPQDKATFSNLIHRT